MSEATDVLHSIDQLRRDLSGYHGQLKAHNDLQIHCDRQRKRIAELEGLYAEAKAEKAKLREYITKLEMANLDVTARLTDYIGQYDPTDAFVAEVKAENDKLREVAGIVAYCMQGACGCDGCRVNGGAGKVTEPAGCDGLLDLLRELGVVADGQA